MDEERDRDIETERLIVGRNQHSIYRLCPAHGFGVHGPLEDECPSCGERCILYLSAEDIRQLLDDTYRRGWREGGDQGARGADGL